MDRILEPRHKIGEFSEGRQLWNANNLQRKTYCWMRGEVASDFLLLLWDKPCKIIWDKPCKIMWDKLCKFCGIKPCKKVITLELPPVQKRKAQPQPSLLLVLSPLKNSSKDKWKQNSDDKRMHFLGWAGWSLWTCDPQSLVRVLENACM